MLWVPDLPQADSCSKHVGTDPSQTLPFTLIPRLPETGPWRLTRSCEVLRAAAAWAPHRDPGSGAAVLEVQGALL